MEMLEADAIRRYLEELGKRAPGPEKLLLVGGSALCLLGSPRPTPDINYAIDSPPSDELRSVIDCVARDMRLNVGAVPIGQSVPVPADAAERHLFVGQFGPLEVYIFDPYSIALSKIDRGFDTDINDVVFLARQDLVNLDRLEQILRDALEQAIEFAMSPVTALAHLGVVRDRLHAL